MSVFILETGWGESFAFSNCNNPAGIVCGDGYCRYGSSIDGIEAMFTLMNDYTQGSIDYVGTRKTVAQVRSKWSEADDTNKVVALWRAIYEQ